MDIRPIGDDLEAVCSGCGEVMLLLPGDTVNCRIGPPVEVGGVRVPLPKGVLCSACDRRENSESNTRVSVKFVQLSCSECGRGLTPEEDFETVVDEDGGFGGVVCSECSEPWRGSCEAN